MFDEPVRFFTDLATRGARSSTVSTATTPSSIGPSRGTTGLPFPEARPRTTPGSGSTGRASMAAGAAPDVGLPDEERPRTADEPGQAGLLRRQAAPWRTHPRSAAGRPRTPRRRVEEAERPLREALAKHREIASCGAATSGSTSLGLVFEGYGPVGERRSVDLGGRPVDAHARFPDGGDGNGLAGPTKPSAIAGSRTSWITSTASPDLRPWPLAPALRRKAPSASCGRAWRKTTSASPRSVDIVSSAQLRTPNRRPGRSCPQFSVEVAMNVLRRPEAGGLLRPMFLHGVGVSDGTAGDLRLGSVPVPGSMSRP